MRARKCARAPHMPLVWNGCFSMPERIWGRLFVIVVGHVWPRACATFLGTLAAWVPERARILRPTNMPGSAKDNVTPCKGGRAVVFRTTPAPVGHLNVLRA